MKNFVLGPALAMDRCQHLYVSGWNSHHQISPHRWTCHHCHFGMGSHHPGPWIPNNPVKAGIFITKSFLPCAQSTKVCLLSLELLSANSWKASWPNGSPPTAMWKNMVGLIMAGQCRWFWDHGDCKACHAISINLSKVYPWWHHPPHKIIKKYLPCAHGIRCKLPSLPHKTLHNLFPLYFLFHIYCISHHRVCILTWASVMQPICY